MPSQKTFLTYKKQLDYLADDKNLIITDRQYAEKMLKQISYFSLVGGYKELFRNPTTKKYKDGTTFEEIIALYKFDENLRELFLRYLLVIEQKMRSLISYSFTEQYGENQSHYLSPRSYSNRVPASRLNRLSKIINQFLSSTTHITENDLLNQMGFPINWKKISSYRI